MRPQDSDLAGRDERKPPPPNQTPSTSGWSYLSLLVHRCVSLLKTALLFLSIPRIIEDLVKSSSGKWESGIFPLKCVLMDFSEVSQTSFSLLSVLGFLWICSELNEQKWNCGCICTLQMTQSSKDIILGGFGGRGARLLPPRSPAVRNEHLNSQLCYCRRKF